MKGSLVRNINIPGLRNSGPDHWQTDWETRFPDQFQRVSQVNWEQPDMNSWVKGIENTLVYSEHSNLVLIGHSVGCATIVHWHLQYKRQIAGALFVAPSDVDRADFPSYITGFDPMPTARLPFPTIVVASTNDHVVSLDRARHFAENWGSEFVEIENGGHIEPKSGFGRWELGLELVKKLRNK